MSVASTRPRFGRPCAASIMAGTVVTSSNSMIRGLVSATYSDTTCATRDDLETADGIAVVAMPLTDPPSTEADRQPAGLGNEIRHPSGILDPLSIPASTLQDSPATCVMSFSSFAVVTGPTIRAAIIPRLSTRSVLGMAILGRSESLFRFVPAGSVNCG